MKIGVFDSGVGSSFLLNICVLKNEPVRMESITYGFNLAYSSGKFAFKNTSNLCE
jgi:hypothetical protein